VPSGIAALLVATVSLWMVIVDWFRPGRRKARSQGGYGASDGICGLALLSRACPFGRLGAR